MTPREEAAWAWVEVGASAADAAAAAAATDYPRQPIGAKGGNYSRRKALATLVVVVGGDGA